MIHKHYQGLQWLEFELLADCPLIHASFMRHGGGSSGTLESLNLGRTRGDKPENVSANLKQVAAALSISDILSARICHGDAITAIDSAKIIPPMSDGLSTKKPNLGLMVTQADCQAAIFYDPILHALANVHCGWRGNVQNIYAATVKHMQQVYGSTPNNLLVCISPSLGPESAQFINYKHELPAAFCDFQIKPEYFDLWAISAWQLKEAGVLPQHIQIAGIDTYANTKDYFSHRRHNQCGRQATISALRS